MTTTINDTPTKLRAPEENARPETQRAAFSRLLQSRINSASTMTEDFLERQLREQLRFLEPDEGERLVIETLAAPTASGTFNHFAWVRYDDMAIKQMSELVQAVPNGPPMGIFIHVNAIKRDCTAKLEGNRWSRQGKGAGFASKDVDEIRVLKIDVDAVREVSGTSATSEEMTRAMRLAATIYCDLAKLLGSDRALAFLFSGNGVQIHARLQNLANDGSTVATNKRIWRF